MTLLERWERFWFAPIPPHIYALLRIAIGALACISLLGLRDLSTFWELSGLVPMSDRGLGVKTYLIAHGWGEVAGRLLYFGCLAAFAAMTVGFRSGMAVALALAASLVQLSWNSLPLSGAHALLQAMLLCLIWADCGSVWSVDAWLKHRDVPRSQRQQPSPYAIAPLRLLQCQIALVYLSSGLWKLFNPPWRDGSALHYILNNNVFHRFPYSLPDGFDIVLTIATYVTLLWEIGFVFLVIWRPTRKLALLAGVFIHLGMMLGIEIGLFSLFMLAGYVAFLDPHRLPELAAPLLARFHLHTPKPVARTRETVER